MGLRGLDPEVWRRVNDRFRRSGQFYVEAPRPRPYRRKARLMFDAFPETSGPLVQAAYLVKNLVNLQRFPDANKRTASVLLEAFLEANGYRLTCDDEAFVGFMLEVQRRVPPSQWDGRSFSLRQEYIPWQEDPYHAFLLTWLADNTKSKE